MTGPSAAEGRIVIFGEVLFDHFPDGSRVLGGAPFNVAWHLRGFGADPLLVSRIGRDELGDRVFEEMTRWELQTSGLQRDASHPTGTVEVQLKDGEPSFDIVPHRAYDYIRWEESLAASKPSLLYLGSLALRHDESRATAQRYLGHHEPPVFLDVNLRPPWWDGDRVHGLLERASEIKLNENELAELVPGTLELEERALQIFSLFRAERLYVTRGSRGAVAFSADGAHLEVRPEGPVPVVDTVGAGDAFSSVLILGRVLGWPLAKTLGRAQDFAAKVVGMRGATVADRIFYKSFADAWSLR